MSLGAEKCVGFCEIEDSDFVEDTHAATGAARAGRAAYAQVVAHGINIVHAVFRCYYTRLYILLKG